MTDNGSGYLQVGHTEQHEVVINLPRDMTGHIVFSPEQARALAASLTRAAGEAERAAELKQRDALAELFEAVDRLERRVTFLERISPESE